MELGTRFVKSVLDNHIKIIYRCLYIGRPALANPALEILTNITTFHRGILTNDLFSAFDFSANAIPKLLALKEDVKVEETKRKQIRSNLIKFFLSFISNSSVIVKRDLIAQKKFITGWFKYLSYDDADTIVLMLETLEQKVLREPSFLRATKINLFNDWSVTLIARQLGRADVPTGKTDTIGTIVLNFLQFLTSDMTYGIRFPSKQWYLSDTAGENENDEHKVNNRVLLSLIKSLKPWEHIQRQDLVLSILSNCPELVAPYLNEDYALSLDPKMTVFWFSNILFFSRLIQIPLAPELTNSTSFQPPKMEVMVEHILPRPLSKSALSKSLLHPTALVKYNACQIIIFAFQKLETVIALFRSNGWVDSYYLLLEEMLNRIPDIQTIVTAVNSIENLESNPLIKTVLVKAIALYAKTLPEIFVKSKFSLPNRLTTSLEKTDLDGLELVDLRNLLEIQAKLGGIGKWWNKMPDLPYSLFTTLLRLSALLNDELFTKQITSLVEYLSKPTMLFRQSTVISPVSILMHSLRTTIPFMSADEQAKIWKLFDESISRCLRSPYKYVDQLALIQKTVGSDHVSVSPFLAIIIEQWKFVDKTTPYENVQKWLQKYIRDCIITGENIAIVKELARVAELPLHQALVEIDEAENFATIQQKWASSSDETVLKTHFCERVISMPVPKLNAMANEYIRSPIDLFFVRFRLLHEHDKIASDYLWSKLNLLPTSLRSILLFEEFWNDVLTPQTFAHGCKFLSVLQNAFTSQEVSADKNSTSLISRLENLISSESLSVKQRAKLLQCSAWILDKPFLQAQLEFFMGQSVAYDISSAFEHYLKQCEESLSEDVFKKLIDYGMQASSEAILKSVKNYVDKAPADFIVRSSFVQSLKEYCNKEEFSASQLLSSLIKRIPLLDTSAIEGFVGNSFIDDFTFLTIVREFLSDAQEESKDALQPLISSAVSIIIKVLKNPGEVSPLLIVAISVADQLLTFQRNELLEQACIHFVSESKGPETILPETVSLAGQLFAISDEKPASLSAIRIWSQRCVLWLNKRLAEDDHIGEKADQLIASLTFIVNKYKLNLWLVVPTDSLNVLLEIASNKYLDRLSVLNLIASVILPNRLAGKQIEFTKLLQIILNHDKVLSLMEMDRSLAKATGSGLTLAYIIFTLFHVDVTRHSTKAVQDKVLALCMGTQRAQDMLLIEVLRKIESRNSISFANSIYSWVFSATTAEMFDQSERKDGLGENYDDTLLSDAATTKLSPLFRETREGFEATVESYVIKNTVKNFDCTVQFFPYLNALGSGHALSFEEKFKFLNDYTRLLRSEFTYDPEFLMLLLASSNLVKDGQVTDLKTLVETGGLGAILCCLAYPESITSGIGDAPKQPMQNHIAATAKSFLQACLAGIKDSTYREEDLLRILLTKILFFWEDVSEEDEGPKTLPMSVAVFLAQILEVTANPGHFLYVKAITSYVLAGHSIRPTEIPLYSQLTTTTKADDGPSGTGNGDLQGKELVWLADTLISGLVTLNDVNLYLRVGVFEWLFNITSTIPLVAQSTSAGGSNHVKFQNSFYVANHLALRQKTKALVERAQEICGGSTALLTRSGILAWLHTEQTRSEEGTGQTNSQNEREQVAKLGLRTVLTVNQSKLKEWTNTSDLRVTTMGLTPRIEK